MLIYNFTQHHLTKDQRIAGVIEPCRKLELIRLITFDEKPSRKNLFERAASVAEFAKAGKYKKVMIGGAPFFMAPLERALAAVGVKAVYAFSKRESAEEKQADGSVTKIQVFRHAGFVEAALPVSATVPT